MTELKHIEKKPTSVRVLPTVPHQFQMMPVLQDPRRDVDVSSIEDRLAALEETQRRLEQFSVMLKEYRRGLRSASPFSDEE